MTLIHACLLANVRERIENVRVGRVVSLSTFSPSLEAWSTVSRSLFLPLTNLVLAKRPRILQSRKQFIREITRFSSLCVWTNLCSQSLPVSKMKFLSFYEVCMTVFFPVCSQAQAVTLTVAQAFRVAFEFWQAAKEGKHGHTPLFTTSLCIQYLLSFGLQRSWCWCINCVCLCLLQQLSPMMLKSPLGEQRHSV